MSHGRPVEHHYNPHHVEERKIAPPEHHYNPHRVETKMTHPEQRRMEEAPAAGGALGCVATVFLILFVALIILIPLWGIWMWVPRLWQKSQAHNQNLLDWANKALYALFSLVLLNPFFEKVIKGMCYAQKEGQHMTVELQKAHEQIDTIETFIKLCIELWMAYLAITGAGKLSDMTTSDSDWFHFSMISMVIIMMFYFMVSLMFVLSMIAVCCGAMAQHEHGWKGMENKMYGRNTSRPQANYQQFNEGHQLRTGH